MSQSQRTAHRRQEEEELDEFGNPKLEEVESAAARRARADADRLLVLGGGALLAHDLLLHALLLLHATAALGLALGVVPSGAGVDAALAALKVRHDFVKERRSYLGPRLLGMRSVMQ